MRVALVVPGGVDRTGEQRVIPAFLGLMRHLSARHDLQVFALAQEPAPGRWTLCGAHVHNVGGARATRLLRMVTGLRREHGRAPFDVVHALFAGSGGLAAVVAARLLGVPALVHVTGGEACAMPHIGYGGRRTWPGRLREDAVLRGATAVTATSQPVVEQLAALGRPAQRVPLGLDLQSWPLRAPVRRDVAMPARLLHVASLNRVKDQGTLLQACALLAGRGAAFEADVVGEDTLHGAMQARARQLGIADRVRFHGFLTQRLLRPLMERADLLVMSSLHEAGPVAMLEAAAVGVPTVGTAVGHIAEWSPDAALAVPIGRADDLADAIERCIAYEDLRLRLAAAAARLVPQYSAEHTAAQFETLYVRLARGRQRTHAQRGR
jgi:glycosyltransferase involved in cell wall biosynthesis